MFFKSAEVGSRNNCGLRVVPEFPEPGAGVGGVLWLSQATVVGLGAEESAYSPPPSAWPTTATFPEEPGLALPKSPALRMPAPACTADVV